MLCGFIMMVGLFRMMLLWKNFSVDSDIAETYPFRKWRTQHTMHLPFLTYLALSLGIFMKKTTYNMTIWQEYKRYVSTTSYSAVMGTPNLWDHTKIFWKSFCVMRQLIKFFSGQKKRQTSSYSYYIFFIKLLILLKLAVQAVANMLLLRHGWCQYQRQINSATFDLFFSDTSLKANWSLYACAAEKHRFICRKV